MKHLYVLVCFFLLSATAMAQSGFQVQSNTEGFYLGVSLLGAGWNAPDLNMDSENGGGLGLRAGYNFNQNVGLFLGLDGSNINPDTGEDYGLGHFDLGVEGIFGNTTQNVRPFARASYLGMAVVQDDPSGDVTISGAGFGLGAGVYFFPSSNFSLELSYNRSWINLNETKVGSQSVSIDENATTGRLMIGAAYHF